MEKTFLKTLWISLWFAAGSLLLAEETSNANEITKRIVVLGDSITAGYGIAPELAYPALLQKKIDSAKLPYTVSNAGVSGDTTAGGLRRVAWAMGKGADILIVALGGNDGLRGIPPAETKKNLLGIVKKARSKNPEILVFIAGMEMPDNMGADFVEAFKATFPEAAKESKSTLVPFLLEGVGGVAKLNQADRIHPTAEGQEVIAENVWEILKPALNHP